MLPPHRHRSALEEPLVLNNLPSKEAWSGKIAYLDRDGVLNRWSEDYVNNPDEVEMLTDAGKAVGELRRSGFRICVVTNQSPIGRGLWDHHTLQEIHDSLQSQLLKNDSDAEIDLLLYSPYAPYQASWARKPNPGMLEAGRQLIDNAHKNEGNLQISFGSDWVDRPSEENSVLVGDRSSDLEAAERFGVRGIRCDHNEGIAAVVAQILDSRW
ncbi:MAG: hypothetical protein CMA88_03495 [Euryarchaeota archaeon]|nr:hypothetical protein [Euryarchaeota archaeon]